MSTAMARRPSSEPMGPNRDRLGAGAGTGGALDPGGGSVPVPGATSGAGDASGSGAVTTLRTVASPLSDMLPFAALVARSHPQLPPRSVSDRLNLRWAFPSDNAS